MFNHLMIKPVISATADVIWVVVVILSDTTIISM